MTHCPYRYIYCNLNEVNLHWNAALQCVRSFKCDISIDDIKISGIERQPVVLI